MIFLNQRNIEYEKTMARFNNFKIPFINFLISFEFNIKTSNAKETTFLGSKNLEMLTR